MPQSRPTAQEVIHIGKYLLLAPTVHSREKDKGEKAGFSGTQGQPAEFCQEKHGAMFLARAMGMREEGDGCRD
ncbi:hypothetical protein EYF80_029579 [Liparis tanakae]|uniref:Uncharacterized protein n=1 Tax=Liparis tanakae TaxID=230148 RepID=A0A4Z2H5X4_9TELE|nr:hypothetical protein EYF80_029579 [Liparis tanakae]